MDRSSIRDAGAPRRGQSLASALLVPILIGAAAVALSIGASPNLRGAFGAALALLMLAIALSDYRAFIVPDALTATAFVLALLDAGLFDAEPAGQATILCLIRGAATALPFLALMLAYERWRGRPGLGLGDVKLAAVAGAWLDWLTIVAVIEAAALAALLAYGIWRYILRRPIDATTPLPFGLFLAPAIWAGWLGATWLGG